MKDYSHIVTKVTSSPWMIEESALRMILELLDAHMSGTISQEEIRVRLQESDRGRDRHSRIHRNVGVLSLAGPIFPKANIMTELSGATSVEQFRKEFRQMMSDDGVEAILLDVDSPGGFSDQIEEMAQEIYEANDLKPVYAIANSAMNSAAYYLGSQASKVYGTPSGQMGSVGSYFVHTDRSKQDEMLGEKNTIIKAGRFKAISEQPLTGESRSKLQEWLDSVNADFMSAVARGRKTTVENVAKNYGEGMVLTAKQALEVGMIDGIATIDQVLSHLTDGGPIGGNTAPPVGVSQTGMVRQSYDADKEHSEPGTGLGGEPEPRTPPEEGDRAIENGWRRDSPPIVKELEAQSMNREQLVLLAGMLGVQFNDDTPDEELSKLVIERTNEVVVPLQTATQSAERKQAFMKEYPEEAARIERLERVDRENQARNFADSYETFENDGKHGFSNVVRDLIEGAHMQIADRTFNHDGLKALLDACSDQKTAFVEWGEGGSARSRETNPVRAGTSTQEIRAQFAELVKAAMTEDSLDRSAAIEQVSKLNPELAAAYLTAKP